MVTKKKKSIKKIKKTLKKKPKTLPRKKAKPSVFRKTKKTPKAKETPKKTNKPIGIITHFYDKISVAVVKLFAPLSVGDEIKIRGGEVDFSQRVNSMQVEHQKINTAKKGEEIGLKIAQKAREGYKVFKI